MGEELVPRNKRHAQAMLDLVNVRNELEKLWQRRDALKAKEATCLEELDAMDVLHYSQLTNIPREAVKRILATCYSKNGSVMDWRPDEPKSRLLIYYLAMQHRGLLTSECLDLYKSRFRLTRIGREIHTSAICESWSSKRIVQEVDVRLPITKKTKKGQRP